MTTTTVPHLRLTVQDLKAQYRMGMLTVKGYVYNWLLAARKRGWKLRTTVKDFCVQLGISKSAFYKAIAELRAEPESDFRFEVYGGIELWVEESKNADTVSTVGDTVSTIVDTVSTVMESETPDASHSKAPSAPSDLYTTSSHIEEESLDMNKQPASNGSVRDPDPGPINVAQILAITKQKLMEQIARQRAEREQRWLEKGRRGIVFRPAGVNRMDNLVPSDCCLPWGSPAGAHYQPT
ncbi:hypothetical protein NW840_00165 [Synechococcus sp. R5-13]|uniref:hypothetical protein n=1 Tax=Synechococcus sp. R5-13 TaxID=2291953 RepID=UPI0039C26563